MADARDLAASVAKGHTQATGALPTVMTLLLRWPKATLIVAWGRAEGVAPGTWARKNIRTLKACLTAAAH